MRISDWSSDVCSSDLSSLACPHCAAFHADTLPKIKENYIDTGKEKLIFRDFPIGGRAVMAAMVARCAKPERYFRFVDVLFQSQEKWEIGRASSRERVWLEV